MLDLGIYRFSFAWDILGKHASIRTSAVFRQTGADEKMATVFHYATGAILSKSAPGFVLTTMSVPVPVLVVDCRLLSRLQLLGLPKSVQTPAEEYHCPALPAP